MTPKVGKAAAELIHFARIDTERALECLRSARGEIGWAGSIVAPDDVVAELALRTGGSFKSQWRGRHCRARADADWRQTAGNRVEKMARRMTQDTVYSDAHPPALTHQEIYIVQAVADGARHAEIAKAMGLSFARVHQIAFRLNRKIGAKSAAHAAAIAIREGWVD